MKKNKLYIIGNGFDIFHGIESRYEDFKEYVADNDSDLFWTLDKYFITDELWSDFEETLANIDTHAITEDASNYLGDYGADDWSESYNHDYQYEIQKSINLVTVKLKKLFTEWILSLQIPTDKILYLDSNAKFLTFNYTNTLESLYSIESNNILYIHNKAIDNNSTLILGHSRKPSASTSFTRFDDEDTDVRVAEGNYILDKYFEDTYKQTETIIEENKNFFLDLKEIEEVFILGHSLSPVDLNYFKEVATHINKNALWTVSYRGKDKKEKHKQTIINLGVQESQIKMITLDELRMI